MDGDAVRRQTVLDDCDFPINVQCDNSCGGDCSTSHHKNTVRISDELYNDASREYNHIYVLWTNRSGSYCTEKNGVHTISQKNALVYNHRPVIHFLKIPEKNPMLFMAVTLVHEIAHVFGIEEPYENPEHDVEDTMVCVMEQMDDPYQDYYNNILSNLNNDKPFCEICESEMLVYMSHIDIQ